ncbi:MAG: hypothetical protein WC967_12215 [Balneolaceae bacterium]
MAKDSITSIFAVWTPSGMEPGFPMSDEDKQDSRFTMSIDTRNDYRNHLRVYDEDDEYNRTAGCDISSIFLPFSTVSTDEMPTVSLFKTGSIINREPYDSSSGVLSNNIFPFGIFTGANDTSSETMHHAPLGSGWHRNVVSSDSFACELEDDLGDFLDIRDTRSFSHIRSIGLRLPIIAVGWGYSVDGNPIPNENEGCSGTKFFGGVDYGWEVDPEKYVAAPIDLRYDNDRKVWTVPQGTSMKYASGTDVVLNEGWNVVEMMECDYALSEEKEEIDVYIYEQGDQRRINSSGEFIVGFIKDESNNNIAIHFKQIDIYYGN